MKIKNILLTGDDGYNSLGTRLLIHFLKGKYQLKIAGTKEQQSGVGGKLNFNKKIKWGKSLVDDIEAIWVEGTPCDAVEFAWNYFEEMFDLVISGINLGANVSGALISSGTYAAASRALNLPIAKRGLVISWNCSPKRWLENGETRENLKAYLNYPGEVVSKVIDLALRNNLWECKLLNINLPEKKTTQARFTKPLPNIVDFYYCFIKINKKEHYYIHPSDIINEKKDIQFDAGAIQQGYISITPCQTSVLKEDVYSKLKDVKIEL